MAEDEEEVVQVSKKDLDAWLEEAYRQGYSEAEREKGEARKRMFESDWLRWELEIAEMEHLPDRFKGLEPLKEHYTLAYLGSKETPLFKRALLAVKKAVTAYVMSKPDCDFDEETFAQLQLLEAKLFMQLTRAIEGREREAMHTEVQKVKEEAEKPEQEVKRRGLLGRLVGR